MPLADAGPRPPAGTSPAAVLLAAAVVAAVAVPLSPLVAQQPSGWGASAAVGAWSVEEADDWWELSERAERTFADGSRLGAGLVSWRRFGQWDHALEADGTLRASRDLWLHGRALVTPDASIREDAAAGAGASLALRPFSVGLGYELRAFDEGTQHALLPEVTWYGGAVTVFTRAWLMHTVADSHAAAAMARVTHRVSGRVRLWWGGAVGDEDFVVETALGPEVRTIRNETLLLGGSWEAGEGWTLRLDLAATDTDARLDRAGATLTVRRSP